MPTRTLAYMQQKSNITKLPKFAQKRVQKFGQFDDLIPLGVKTTPSKSHKVGNITKLMENMTISPKSVEVTQPLQVIQMKEHRFPRFPSVRKGRLGEHISFTEQVKRETEHRQQYLAEKQVALSQGMTENEWLGFSFNVNTRTYEKNEEMETIIEDMDLERVETEDYPDEAYQTMEE
tara:strand:+ start:174 stop:704 length:531 start_codon:yes stop_codon:yes gene_type:complete